MIPEKPLVSIGLVTCNRGSILHLAIDQLLNQTYTNIELIISDNASTDNTQEVCETYAKQDRRVRYIRQEKNIGMYPNFNFVLEQAQGEFFLWATDDDEWDVMYIEHVLSLLAKYPEAVVANTNYISFSDTASFDTACTFPAYTALPHSIKTYIPTGAIITYGVHRIESLRKAGGFYIYPSVIPQGIGEAIMIFRVLSQGAVAFSQKALWKKRDSGMTFEKYDVLHNLEFNTSVVFRIQRYLRFPVLYSIDLVIMLKDVVRSSLSGSQKLYVSSICIGYFFQNNIEFITVVVKGVLSVVSGSIRRWL